MRASVVVAGATAQLFTGTLREALDVRSGPDPQPAGLEDLLCAETERTTGADVDQQVRAQERNMPGDDRLLEAIEIADAGDVLTSLSEGLAGMITEKGRSLSGGQRQRVALARALLTEAPTLVLIEPTSALDSHTEARVAAQVHRALRRAHDRRRHRLAAGPGGLRRGRPPGLQRGRAAALHTPRTHGDGPQRPRAGSRLPRRRLTGHG